MVRTIVKPNNQNVMINVPENFVGKQVEIIAFTIDEADAENLLSDQTLTYQASSRILAKDWLTSEEDIAWQNL